MLWIAGSAKADPVPSHTNEIPGSRNIVGVATQIITNALMNVSFKTKVTIIKQLINSYNFTGTC